MPNVSLLWDKGVGCSGALTGGAGLARGGPVGTKLEYLHGEILAEAFRGRRHFELETKAQKE